MTASELRSAAERITWFHSMDLGGGVPTDGSYDPTRTLGRLGLPDRLDGKRPAGSLGEVGRPPALVATVVAPGCADHGSVRVPRSRLAQRQVIERSCLERPVVTRRSAAPRASV